jgi:multidrug efflux pump subunit AcrA (membrane-fusion protein)
VNEGRSNPGRTRITAFTIVVIALFASGCSRPAKARSQSTQAPAAEQPPVLAVTVARVETAPIESTLTLLGTTVAPQHVILRAPAAGRIAGLRLKVGDPVHKGEVVAYLISREIEAAQQGLAIAQKLDPKDAPALARSVERYSKSRGIPIVSPDNGVVATQPLATGQTVSFMEPIVDLIDPRSIYIEANVPEEDVAMITPGMKVHITSPLKPGVRMPGRVAALLPSLNPASATSPIRIDFASSTRLVQAGAPVEVDVVTQSVPDAVVIPPAALFQGAGQKPYVFVAGADGRAHRTPVTVGIRTPRLIQVTSGLRPGESVITSGGYALSDGLRITVAQEPE